MPRVMVLLAFFALALGLIALPGRLVSRVTDAPDFVHFESAHVHPMALTPGGGRLLIARAPRRQSLSRVRRSATWSPR